MLVQVVSESGKVPPDNPLDTLISQQQRGTGEGLLDSRRISSLKTRPLYDRLEPDILTETGGLELSPTIYDDAEGRVIDKYGVRLLEVIRRSEFRNARFTSIFFRSSPLAPRRGVDF